MIDNLNTKKVSYLRTVLITALVLCFAFVAPVSAANIDETAESIANLETALTFVWLILAGAIVFFMHAGFSLLESGLTRTKNTANILMKNLITISLGVIIYWIIGWGIMYGASASGLVGTDQFLLSGADNSLWNEWWFQMVFAATAATIVSGALAERTSLKAYIAFTIVMVALIYPIHGHWVWGDEQLSLLSGSESPIVTLIGAALHDFAGSGVVHSIGGYAALAGAIVVGARIGKFKNGVPQVIPGHSLTFAFLGTLILAFGWIGFNGGSTLDGNDAYMNLVIVNTFLSAAAGALTVLLITWKKVGKPDPSLTANGLLAGLVSITAPCGSVENWAAIVIGIVGGIILYSGVMFNENVLKVDDPVGAIAVHGYAGSWGLLSVGIFSVGIGNGILVDAVYAAEGAGLIYGGINQFIIQMVGVLFTIIWAFGVSYLVFKLIDATIGMRVSETEEIIGLDICEHGVQAYPEYILEDGEIGD
ncbi:ammonium transporter [Methanosalsum natronophilum]|uniref:Ammonium transporter n=1 Tax=Methanosalsum natronophilum TaxID=768733 RepID=A0A3R8C9H6_9EURY|nr:MAG: ammonium transporter [Methanosalsum natronophilum]